MKKLKRKIRTNPNTVVAYACVCDYWCAQSPGGAAYADALSGIWVY